MATRARKDIKKLSTAIKRGLKIAKENGIRHNIGSLRTLDENAKVCSVCALGYGVLGITGVKNFPANATDAYGIVQKLNGVSEPSICFASKARDLTNRPFYSDARVIANVMELNDNVHVEPEAVVELLEACGL